MTLPAVGIDVEQVQRFVDAHPRLFTEAEWERCAGRTESLAGIWCAKEAVVKALSRWRSISVRDVEIGHDSGRPTVEIDGFEIDISISHTTDYAVAVAIAAPISRSS